MAGSLGTITGEVRINVAQALASYAALRAANASTMLALRSSSAAFVAFGKAATIGGLAMLAGFAVAANAAADFEKQLDFFGAVSASTQKEMAAVRKEALLLGQDTIFSAGQIADSFVELGKAGVSADQIINGVGRAVANLGAAADIPLDQAAIILTSAMQQFHLAAQDTVHVTDLLAGAANASIVEVEDLGVSLKYVGGVANALGFDIEDVINALSILGKAGIRGSTAGTSLRQTLLSLSGTSVAAKDALKDLGIITEDGSNKFFDAEGNAKSLAQVFQILKVATKDMTKEQRSAAYDTIFQNRAMASALELTHAGAKGFRKMNEEISKTTAADVAHERLDNLKGDIEILRGNIETFLIKAGTPFQDFLRKVVQALTKVVQAFGKLPDSVQTGIFSFLLIAGTILTLMGAMSLFIGMILRIVDTLMKLWPALKLVWNIASILIRGIVLLAGVIAGLSTGVLIVIAVVLAVVAVLVLLYMKSEAFRNFIDGVGRALVTAFKAVVAWFKTLPATFATIWENIKGFFTNPTGYIKDAWENIVAFFKALPGRMLSIGLQLFQLWVKVWGMILSFAMSIGQKIVSAILSFLASLPQRILALLLALVQLWARLWLLLFTKAVELAGKIVSGVLNFLSKLPGRVGYIIGFMIGRAIKLFLQFAQKAAQLAAKLVTGVINFIRTLPGKIAAFIINAKNKAIALFNAMVHLLINLAARMIVGIINFVRELPGRIATFLIQAKDKAIQLFSDMVSRLVTFARELPGKIRDAVSELPNVMGDILDKMIQVIKDAITGAFNAVKDFGSAMWEGFKDGIGIGSPSYLERAMFTMNDTMEKETKVLAKHIKTIRKVSAGLKEPLETSNTGMQRKERELKAVTSQMIRRAKALRTQQIELEKNAARTFEGMANRKRGVFEGVLTVKRDTPTVNVSPTPVSVVSPQVNQNVYGTASESALDQSARKLRDIVDAGFIRP